MCWKLRSLITKWLVKSKTNLKKIQNLQIDNAILFPCNLSILFQIGKIWSSLWYVHEICIKIGCIQNEVVCSTTVGQISTTECTRYFRQCNYGEWGVPQEVAMGTYCYRGVQVNAATCNQRGGNTCSFTGIRCVDGDENVITTQCSSYYQQCINGVTSNIIGTTDGTSCLIASAVASVSAFLYTDSKSIFFKLFSNSSNAWSNFCA